MKAINIFALLGGLLFSTGLAVSGMTLPSKIKAFFRPGETWDPSIGILMAMGLMIYIPVVILARKRKSPMSAKEFIWPEPETMNIKFFVGAILFGIAWGFGGICPGPALVITGGLSTVGLIFIPALLDGLLLGQLLEKKVFK